MASSAQKTILRDEYNWPQSVLDRSDDDAADVLLDSAFALVADPNRRPRWEDVRLILGRRSDHVAALLDGSDPDVPQTGVVAALARFLGVTEAALRVEMSW